MKDTVVYDSGQKKLITYYCENDMKKRTDHEWMKIVNGLTPVAMPILIGQPQDYNTTRCNSRVSPFWIGQNLNIILHLLLVLFFNKVKN